MFSTSRELQLPWDDHKVIVYKSQLLKIFHSCRECSKPCSLVEESIGTFLKIISSCASCGSTSIWNSQPTNETGGPPLNLLISASIYFTGNSYRKFSSAFQSINVNFISESLYYYNVRKFLQPTIATVWKRQNNDLLLNNNNLIVAGDMRADSPGHCAKYGTYTLLDVSSNKIIHTEIVQVE